MKLKSILGISITVLHLIISIVFALFLYQTKFMPNKIGILVCCLIVISIALIFVLTMKKEKKIRFGVGIAFAVLLWTIYGFSGYYILQAVKTVNHISKETTTESIEVGIYVRKEDQATKLKDLAGETFGFLDTLEEKNIDVIADKIADEIGEIQKQVYSDAENLIDCLINTKEIRAMVLSEEHYQLLAEGDHKFQERIKKIGKFKIKISKESEKDKTSVNSNLPKTFTVYISGIDSRSGLVERSRSDVNILATVNTETREVLLVSTPRDYYIPLSISKGVPDKLTHAGIYGIDVSMDTLEMLYKTNVDYYFRINFSGFEKIVDALDGITIESDYTFDSKNMEGFSFVKGKNQVNGEKALAFVRERYSFKEGDRQRGKNQLAVIEGVIKKAMSPTLLKNYTKILKSVEGSFETNVPYSMIAELARDQIDREGKWKVSNYSVDGSGAKEKPYSMSSKAYVMIPDMDTVNTAIKKMEVIGDRHH